MMSHRPADPGHISVLFLCTGNAARSVLAGAALCSMRPDVEAVTAGTLSVDGLPMSWRMRAALDAVGLARPKHASAQVTRIHLDHAALVVGMAPEHVEWVRRNHPDVSHRTATLKHLADALAPPGPPLADRVEALHLVAHQLGPHEEIIDPGGGDVEAFIACGHEVVDLVRRLAARL
jgi:protein-tyrosine-phosphatase